ncbi:MAG: GAF domain-containing protein [Chloroflexi bacterium]|nr:GAF domain-containing protein [Chloroflexota bacterium]
MSDVQTKQQRMNRVLEISRELTATVSRKSLLHKIVEAAAELTNSQVASILLFDEHAGELRFIAARALADELANIPVPVDDSIAGIAFTSGEPQIVPDVRTDPRYYKAVEEQIGFEAYSLLAVPLQFKDRRIGVLEVANKQSNAEFTPEDVETLAVLAAQATVTIENARLVEALQESHDELEKRVEERTVELSETNAALKQQARDREQVEKTLQHRNQELAVLLDVAKSLSTTLRLDKLLERALDELERVVPYDTALISMLRGEHWWMVASHSQERILPKRFDLGELPLVQRTVHECAPVIVPDVSQDPNWRLLEGAEWIRSWMGVPLISRDKVIGILMMNSHCPNTYDQETSRMVSAFGHHVALAIENSRLYEQVRVRLREATMLHSVTMALSSTLDTDQIMSYVTRSLCEILNGTSAEICCLNEQADAITLTTHYMAPERTSIDQTRHADLGRTRTLAKIPFVTEALAQGNPLQVHANDPQADPHLLAGLSAHNAQSMLLLPMVTSDVKLGFSLVWDNHTPRRFTESEVATGQMVMRQAAITVDNARLVKELRQRTVKLQARNEELDAFAHTVAHDLKTPLSSLIGFSNLLEQKYSQMSGQDLRQNLQTITLTGDKMNSIIDELLLLASVRKMEEVEIEPLNMDRIVIETHERLTPLIAKYQAEIIVTNDWPTALGRGPWVEQVWTNFISNALKYGGRPPHVELGATKQKDDTVRFWVRDNGPGLTPEEQDQLFTPFTRLHQISAEGYGLGLSIVQRIVEKMGGRVGIESEIGHGSAFFFTLPSAPH